MHGSLLPKYRGRVPVNWAIVKGETQTGATLHYMVEKPDAGEIVAQRAVPILADDTAKQVFDKVCVAAECALYEVLPDVITGTAQRLANDLSKGSYFGGRKPEDGRIDLAASSSDIYNLIRAVAPPYPGAYLQAGTETLWVDGAERVHSSEDESTLLRLASKTPGSLVRWQGQSYLRGATGGWLKLHLRSA